MELYTVFVGGGEVNDTYFLNRQDAERLAQKFIEDGYDDTHVVVISPEEVVEWFKP
jgi:uncharacterized protein YdaT